MKNIAALLLFFGVIQVSIAQKHYHGHHPIPEADSLPKTLGRDLDKGYFEFHARSFFMGTVNKGSLMDYSAMAAGAGLGYYSPSWKGFHLGFSGFFVFQLFENNIYEQDPTTNNYNRYEVLLFDMNNFKNKKDLDRLEELYVNYEHKHLLIQFGRQKFDSPFMNEQDNRMRPNIYSGLSVNYSHKDWEFIGAAFNHVTIRGTVDWYSMEESYGVYPFGRNPFGTASNYKGNVESLGVGVLGAKYKTDKWKHQFWNYYNENVFILSFMQNEYALKRAKTTYNFGFQALYQTAINDGGNEDPTLSYILKDEFTYAFGGKMGVQRGRHEVSLNNLHISDNGRFLFPREWGRERFFASIPRERFEGAGGVNAFTLKYKYVFKNENMYTELGASSVTHQSLDNIRLNKYGVPSYYHFTGLVDYKFKGYLEGFDFKVLIAHKSAHHPSDVEDQYRINRVDLWNFNLILDYRF
jgi:hypothetical protein